MRSSATSSHLFLVTAVLVTAWSLAHTISYLKITFEKHPYEAASTWVYEHIPPGATIAGVHWDDRVPVSLPGRPSPDSHYESVELGLYEADTPAKLELVSNQLQGSDYIIFPTQRIPGSIPRRPEGYKYTTALLRLLYGGKLGFQTVYSKRAGGPDFDFADESLSVYDNPRVTIFKNTEHLSAWEIKRRILNVSSFEPLPDLHGILKPGVQDDSPAAYSQVLRWVLLLIFAGLVGAPISMAALPRSLDLGLGLSKIFGIGVLGLLCWVIPTVFHLAITDSLIQTIGVLLLAAAGISLLVTRFKDRPYLREPASGFWVAEILFWAGFSFFLLIRAYQPEIFWGEKPMDFTMLNFFTRIQHLPAEDPWAPGATMHYYYLGTYFFAICHRLFGVDPAIGYQLSIATIGGLLLSASFSVIAAVGRKVGAAVWGAIAVVLLANLDVAYLALMQKKTMNFDLYWASSRTFTTPAINEYPLWSLLFADLHAHLMALPYVLAMLALSLGMLKEDPAAPHRRRFFHRLVLGAVWGCLLGINGWDFLEWALILTLLFLVQLIRIIRANWRNWFAALASSLEEGVVTLLGAAVLGLPFYLTVYAKSNAGMGWVTKAEFNTLWQIVRHFGQWLIPLVIFLPIALAMKWRGWRSALQLLWCLPVGAAPLALGLASRSAGITGQPWDILLLSCFLGVFSLWTFSSAEESDLIRGASFCAWISSICIGFVELVFVMDRMNTIFKFFNSLWFFLGLAAAMMAAYLFETTSHWKKAGRMFRAAGASVLAAIAIVQLFGSIVDIRIMTTFRRVPGPRPALDGTAYLAESNPSELSMYRWINKNLKGTPTILEAFGPSYREFTRVSMNTGLPAFLGWNYHVLQRGTPQEEIQRREYLIPFIYNTPSAQEAHRALAANAIEFVVVGQVERENYSAAALRKFAENQELFREVFASGDVRLYQVRRQSSTHP